MTATETFVCTVCGETEEREELFEYCNGCGELYHFNRTSGPGKDCGDAWIEDEEVGLQFFCNTCMERQKTEDQVQMAELARAAAAGALTPELVARAMQAMGSQAAGNASFAGNFPGLPQSGVPFPGVPAPGVGVPIPEPISAADLMGKFEMSLPSEEAPSPGRAEKAPADAPPALRSQRKPARRFRRIE